MPYFPGSPFGPGHPFASRTPYTVTAHISVVMPPGVPPPEIADLDAKEAALAEYGWDLTFIDEPDGGTTVVVKASGSDTVLKTLTVGAWDDAWIELGIQLRPPSREAREEREQRGKG